jgi:hypothetical protein
MISNSLDKAKAVSINFLILFSTYNKVSGYYLSGFSLPILGLLTPQF